MPFTCHPKPDFYVCILAALVVSQSASAEGISLGKRSLSLDATPKDIDAIFGKPFKSGIGDFKYRFYKRKGLKEVRAFFWKGSGKYGTRNPGRLAVLEFVPISKQASWSDVLRAVGVTTAGLSLKVADMNSQIVGLKGLPEGSAVLWGYSYFWPSSTNTIQISNVGRNY